MVRRGEEIAVDYERSCKCLSKARAVWVMVAKKNVPSSIFSYKVVFLISDVCHSPARKCVTSDVSSACILTWWIPYLLA